MQNEYVVEGETLGEKKKKATLDCEVWKEKNNMKTIGSNFSGGKNRSCTFGSSYLFELIFFIAKKK